jgi:uncharacterized protein (DUF1786 family)
MRILAIGIGTDTQDILLLDTAAPLHTNVKMVMPSATEIAARRIRRATQERRPVLLTGVTMGAGPCHRALEAHLKEELAAFATEKAALTFDDDLTVVRAMGVTVVSEDEAAVLRGVERIEMRDLDLVAIRSALAAFEVPVAFDGLAFGCLDHGAPPPGVSDRQFRFDHLRRVLRHSNDLHAFALTPDEVPEYLTRVRSMLASRDVDVPTVFLDTGVAAALGALRDPHVRAADEQVVLHLGNMHALAFHTSGTRIHAVMEHHTDVLSTAEIESLTERFREGTLTHEEVIGHLGHGVHYLDGVRGVRPFLVVTGPQRSRLRGSRLKPHFPETDGDAVVGSCLGLVDGFAARYPNVRDEIEAALVS